MNDYVVLYTKIWNDKKFKKLGDARFPFLYLLTNENINLSGIYELDIEIFETKMKLGSKSKKMFKDLIDSGMIKWDEEYEIIWVVNRFK